MPWSVPTIFGAPDVPCQCRSVTGERHLVPFCVYVLRLLGHRSLSSPPILRNIVLELGDAVVELIDRGRKLPVVLEQRGTQLLTLREDCQLFWQL